MFIYDFDGVLIDSLSEVIVTAYNTVSGKLSTRLQDLPQGYERLFRKYRYHLQPAADFPVYAEWCLKKCSADNQAVLTSAEYGAVLAAAEEPPEERRRRFFSTRRRFLETNREAWLDLNQPYRPLWDVLVERGGAGPVILTNKNKTAVLELSHHFGLRVVPDNVYAAEAGATKIENLEAIRQRFQQPKYYFIDDSLLNLRELENHGSRFEDVTFLLANWGYTGPEDEENASNDGFRSFTQDEFLAFMKDFRVMTENL